MIFYGETSGDNFSRSNSLYLCQMDLVGCFPLQPLGGQTTFMSHFDNVTQCLKTKTLPLDKPCILHLQIVCMIVTTVYTTGFVSWLQYSSSSSRLSEIKWGFQPQKPMMAHCLPNCKTMWQYWSCCNLGHMHKRKSLSSRQASTEWRHAWLYLCSLVIFAVRVHRWWWFTNPPLFLGVSYYPLYHGRKEGPL